MADGSTSASALLSKEGGKPFDNVFRAPQAHLKHAKTDSNHSAFTDFASSLDSTLQALCAGRNHINGTGSNHTALEGSSLLNSTLQALQLHADGFMERCGDYGDALLQSAGSVEGLQSWVAAHREPLQQLWLKIYNSMKAALPPLSAALVSLGQEAMASQLEVLAGQAGTSITMSLENAARSVVEVGKATTLEQRKLALAQLNASTTEGLSTVASCEAQGVEILQGVVRLLVQRSEAPPDLQAKLTRLLALQIQATVKTLADGLKMLFRKMLEASELAVEGPHGFRVEAVTVLHVEAAFLGCLLVAACLARAFMWC